MISTLDRYVFLDVLKALLAILLVLSLIIDGLSFMQYLEMVIRGEINADVVFDLLALEIVRSLPRLIPPAFFLAILYAVGRMYRDSEMIALQSCAISTLRVYRAVFFLALPLALFVAWMTLSVNPWASSHIARIVFEQEDVATELMGVSAGQFSESSRGDTVFYVESISSESRRMQDIFVHYNQQGRRGVIAAEGGYQTRNPTTGERYLVLTRGHRYEGEAGQADYSVASFEKYGIKIAEPAGEERAETSRRALSTATLLESQLIKYQAEFQERVSTVLAVLVVVLMSMPLSRSLPRQGPHGRIILGFFAYFFYFNMEALSKGWMEDGVTAAWLGMWWIHLLVALSVVGYLLLDHPRFRRFRRTMRQKS